MKLLILVISSLVNFAFSQSIVVSINATVIADECVDLNQRRIDLQDCCEYPKIHFFRIFASHCIDECVGTKDICCGMLCVWRNTRVTFHDGAVNLKGLKQTLVESVTHRDEWEELVEKVVDQCDSEGEL